MLALREQIHGQATAKAIEDTALTKAWVIDNLRENALKCMGKIPVNVSIIEGEAPVQEFQYHPTGANRALELLGRELNMFIERHEVGDPGEFARMSDAELNDMLGQYAKAVGLPDSSVMKLVELYRGKLARYKWPKDVRFLASQDEFPRSTSGKIQRQELEKLVR